MFSEVTEAACEECVNNDASTDEDHSQYMVLSSSLERESVLKVGVTCWFQSL